MQYVWQKFLGYSRKDRLLYPSLMSCDVESCFYRSSVISLGREVGYVHIAKICFCVVTVSKDVHD